MGWFGNNEDKEKEPEEPEEPFIAICPHCNKEISKIKPIRLDTVDGDYALVMTCSECNKILGAFEY